MSDWDAFLSELGLTQSDLDKYLKSKKFIDSAGEVKDDGNPAVYRSNSKIHRYGMFSKENFNNGDIIGYARVDNFRTNLGRYTNHSNTNNTRVYYSSKGSNAIMKAESPISSNDEILINYRHNLYDQKFYE